MRDKALLTLSLRKLALGIRGPATLFLLNDQVVELRDPEAHLHGCWRSLGCGNPRGMRAQEAIDFVGVIFKSINRSEGRFDVGLATDLASLIISKTGANALLMKPTSGGGFESRLRDLPQLVLETYARGAANDGTGATRKLHA